MLVVGCSGFPIPATRYFKEFLLEEVSDTFLGVPGPALVRRWKREAPEGFVFAAVAPKELSQDGFKFDDAAAAAWDAFVPVANDLGASAVVLTSAPDLPSNKANRAAARTVLERIAKSPPARLVWEPPPGWELKDAESTAKDLNVLVARDPVRHAPFAAKVPFAYYRLPGPAGHKSRYEDAMLETAAQRIREGTAATTLVVLANVDMHADAKRLRKLLE